MDEVSRPHATRANWWDGQTPPCYYTYSPQTGETLESGLCDPSQLEPGVWLWPGSSTAVAPPEVGEGRIAVWDGGVWLDCHDRRGEVVWVDGEFRAISTIGQHRELQLIVHDAQYVLPDTNEDAAVIRMWVNDDVIEFEDDPNLLARQVLARWEATGETIRPVDADIETVKERDAREAEAKRRLAEEATALDAEAMRMVEGARTSETAP